MDVVEFGVLGVLWPSLLAKLPRPVSAAATLAVTAARFELSPTQVCPCASRSLPPQDPSLLSQDLINQMLLCFVDGLAADKPVEIQQVSAEGMVHALSFAAENFKDENSAQRDMIMSSICNATLLENIVVRADPRAVARRRPSPC